MIDNNLAASQRAIGESSNLAQVALSYSYNFDDPKLLDYVCILSVLAQAAIDSAKRKFDIDVMEEISLIKQSMDISTRKLPQFWGVIRNDIDKDTKINKDIRCPMNYIYNSVYASYKEKGSTIPISDFFISYPVKENRITSRKVEQLIEKYSLKQLLFQQLKNYYEENTNHTLFLMRQKEFDLLINDIRSTGISNNYKGFISLLINRAFMITPEMKSKKAELSSKTKKNRALLMKVLYTINKKAFLSCFS